MKKTNNILNVLDKAFDALDFLGSDEMFYILAVWYLIIFITILF